MNRNPVLLLLLPILAGCASQHFSKYSGAQIWLTSKSGIANASYAVPVYYGWPERPYRVIGRIQADDGKQEWRSSDTARAARMARSKGGDALMIHCDANSLIANSSSLPRKIPRDHVSALVLKWKSQNEVDEEDHRLDGLRAYLRRSYPALRIESKRDLWEMGVEYVASLGLDINLPQGAAKLEDTLSSLIATTAGDDPSKWLFKGTLRANAPSTMSPETLFYGIATVTRTNDNVTIVSHHGKTGFSFHGIKRDDRLNGQLVISTDSSAFMGAVRGMVLSDKISLSSQGHADGHPVQVTFILLR